MAAASIGRARGVEINETAHPREPHVEIMDASTSDVWLAPHPISPEEFEALEIPDPFVKMGCGVAVMDRAWFTRGPHARSDGPLESRMIGGHLFQLVARPDIEGVRRVGEKGPRILMVQKFHSIGFDAGREVDVLTLPDSTRYVQTTASVSGAPRERELPDGWSKNTITIDADWTIELPAPTTTIWFADFESFQGPIPA